MDIVVAIILAAAVLIVLFKVFGKSEESSASSFGRAASRAADERDAADSSSFDLETEARRLRDRGVSAAEATVSILDHEGFDEEEYSDLIKHFASQGFDIVEVLETLDRETEATREEIAYDAVEAGVSEETIAAFLDAGMDSIGDIDDIESGMFDAEFDTGVRIRLLYKILQRRRANADSPSA